MPDTGPPFNLPFPAPSDLVRNAPDQFEALANATASALSSAAVLFTESASNEIDIAFNQDRMISRDATGTVTFTGSSYEPGFSAAIRIVAGAANRSLVFPAGFKFISFKPTSIDAGKVGVLAVASFGTSEADVVAAFAVES